MGIVLVGGGGHCKSVIQVVKSIGLDIQGILDKKENIGNTVLGSLRITGGDDLIDKYIQIGCSFHVTLGFNRNGKRRVQLYQLISDMGGKFPIVAAPSAWLADGVKVGAGSILLNSSIVNSDSRIGVNSIINTNAVVEHECVIGDNCHIAPSAVVGGAVAVGNSTLIGLNATILPGLRIGDNCIIGAGSVVTKDVPSNSIASGNPAKLKKG